MNEHTFAICAYKDSRYLEDCIKSLENQTVKSEIYIATSTPDEYIDDIAKRHGIPIYVNEGEHGITQDWNFALSKVETNYATIAHQDDVYLPSYTSKMLSCIKRASRPQIFFTDYAELRNGEVVSENNNLRIKRRLLKPLTEQKNQDRNRIKRKVLSLGNPICCPSVTYCMENITRPLFQDHFKSNEDWEAWERLSKEEGSFVYFPEIMMYHRIHVESTTTRVIGEHSRTTEDREMFSRFHSDLVAEILTKLYSSSEKSNQI